MYKNLRSFIKEINLFPFFYLIIIYAIYFILPFEVFDGKTVFNLWTYEEYLAEHFQFILYLSASILALLNIVKNKYKVYSLQNLSWLTIGFICFLIAIEEISFIDLLKDSIFEPLREINISNEINIHNSNFIQPYLHYLYILFNLFFGWFGWKIFSKIEAMPLIKYILFFLFCSLSYFAKELKIFITIIPYIHQEIFEFLMSLGLFLHTLERFKQYSK